MEHRIRPLDQRLPLLPEVPEREPNFVAAFIALDRAMQGDQDTTMFDEPIPNAPRSVPFRERADTPHHPLTTLYLQMLWSMWDRRILPRSHQPGRNLLPIALARQQVFGPRS